MWTKEDENWWSSTQKGLDFKDADADVPQGDVITNLQEDLDESSSVLFNELSINKKTIYPLENIINKECLENILRCSILTTVPSIGNVENTIINLSLGRQVCFNFRALSDKISLLDNAIETKCGDVIKKVVAYLDRTLLPKIFYPLLISRPIALNHLELHYMKEHKREALSTLYTMTGKTNTARLFASYCPVSTKTSKNLMNLQNYQLQFQPLLSSFEADTVKRFRTLLDYQLSKNVQQYATARDLFVECVKKNNLDQIDEDIAKLHLSVEQADWIIMNVYMYEKKYDRLEKRFLQKNKTSWLKSLAFKCTLHSETLLLGMAEHKPDKLILEQFLTLVKDDKKLTLGHKLGCYEYVIRLYCDKRDRNGLLAYKSKFTSNSPFLSLIDKSLNDYSLKWKN